MQVPRLTTRRFPSDAMTANRRIKASYLCRKCIRVVTRGRRPDLLKRTPEILGCLLVSPFILLKRQTLIFYSRNRAGECYIKIIFKAL